MKETVTKSAKKPGSAAVAGSPRKAGGVVKAVASALAKKIAGALAPSKASKAAASTAKPAARPAAKKAAAAKPAAKVAAAKKTAPKPAPKKVVVAKAAQKAPAKAATKAATKAAPKAATGKAVPAVKVKAIPVPQAAEAGVKKTAGKLAVKVGEQGERTNAVPGGTAELADKMKTSVVSKVSEVMTKTTKSTPAVNTDGRLITEDEIRAMSEKDYMNPAQLAFFKARLQQLEKDLLKNAGETTEHLRETVLVPDPADRATIEEEHALELRTRDRERKLLKKVQQSIAAIDGGDYGWCEETGEPIGIPRLIARPTATLSLEAQQRRELKQKLYGD
ncbi:MAG: RNA polymerase-binding protein DksA [Telluria sp.]|nr:RNA polymerase-binding protein DksA [Telluria sp.]